MPALDVVAAEVFYIREKQRQMLSEEKMSGGWTFYAL